MLQAVFALKSAQLAKISLLYGRPKNLWPDILFQLFLGNSGKTVNQAENVLFEEKQPATTPPNEVNLQCFSNQPVQTPTIEI